MPILLDVIRQIVAVVDVGDDGAGFLGVGEARLRQALVRGEVERAHPVLLYLVALQVAWMWDRR